MAIRMSNARALAALDAVVGSAATLKIFTGSAPTNASDADTGTELVSMSCTFGSATDDSGNGAAKAGLSGGTAISGTTSAAGEAGYFRVYPTSPSTTNALFQGTVTDTGSGGDLELNDATVPSGATLTISSLDISLPELGS